MAFSVYRNWYLVEGGVIGQTQYGYDKMLFDWESWANVVVGREEGSPFYTLHWADPADHGLYISMPLEVVGVSDDNGVYYQELAIHDYQPSGVYYYLTNSDYAPGDPLPPLTMTDTYILCFLSGAQVATPTGEVAVETLSIGDLVSTADGANAPVKWIGRRRVAARFAPADRGAVCIERGALSAAFGGEIRPTRDLKLTADHALLLGGVLVQSGALVNGATIRRMGPGETGERYVVWHVETETHALILVDGCPAETFVDNVGRRGFDNHADYVALYGAEAPAMAELDLPRVKSPRQIPAGLRALLATPSGRQAA